MRAGARSLVIDPDRAALDQIDRALQARDHIVTLATDPSAIEAAFASGAPDFVILGAGLGTDEQHAIGRDIRAMPNGDRVFLVVAVLRGTPITDIADDFLLAPFTEAELSARLRVVGTRMAGRNALARALNESRDAEIRATATLHALPDLVVRMTRDGVFLDYSAEDARALYAPPDRIIGNNVRDLMPPAFANACIDSIDAALCTGEAQIFEYQLPMPKGVAHYEARIVVSGADEVIAIVRDVTDRLRIEAHLRAADRMRSLGTLAAGVAHEINNPLSYVLLNVAAVARDLRAANAGGSLEGAVPKLLGRLDDALEGADRVRRIVGDLKAFSRDDQAELGPVDVHNVLDATINIAANEIRHRSRLARKYGDVPLVYGNDKRLGQVFLNLLINAAQALPEGRAEENLLEVETRTEENDRVIIEVRDTGSGIPPEILGHVFDPFFTTKPIGEGTGLGLWICQNIVTGIGGDLSVKSAVGVGTTVAVTLKAASAASLRRAEKAREPSARPPSSPERILIIDDDVRVARSLEMLLEGHDVTRAASGEQAIEILRADDSFDVIFCDLVMPDVTGMDVFEQVRGARPAYADRFIFVTGGAFTPRARAFLASTTRPCLEKPFTEEAVSAAMRGRSRAP